MVETEIQIGPIRPTSGPLAKLGGATVSSQSGSGPLDVRVRLNEQDIRSLQDQIYALSSLLNQLISVPMLIASGPNHQAGVVPDPGSTSGTAKFLREDATWTAVSATALTGIIPVANGGTGTATGSITGTGALTFTPGADSTTAIQLRNAAGVAVVALDTTNEAFGITATGTAAARGLRSSQYNNGVQSARFQLIKGRGTAASPATVASGDNVGQMVFMAFGTTMTTRASVLATVSAAVAVDSVPTDLVFSTGDGATTIERFRITSAGNLVVALAGIPIYANNAAAILGGLAVGSEYRTGADPDPVCIVH